MNLNRTRKGPANLRLIFSIRIIFLLLVPSITASAQVPSIVSFAPASGSVGTAVTITGTNFSNVPAGNIVFFGAVKAAVTSASTTSITVTVPGGATYQPISVTVNGLCGFSSTPFIVTFPGSQQLLPSSFYPKIDTTTDLHPNGIAIADFDGDGKPDVATPNNYSTIGVPASVSILRNTATGAGIAFAAKQDLVTGVLTYAIAAGDLNGDGKPDLISSSIADKTISVFKNTSTTGNISFAPKLDLPTGDNPYSIAIGDIDNDGKPDVAVTNHLSNSVSIFKNNSTGGTISFSPKADFAAALAPGTVLLGDLDSDGKIDMVVTNELSNSISIFKNTSNAGSIAFAAKQDFATGTAPYGAAIGDMNNDGKPDIIVSNNSSNTVSTFKNNSTSGSIVLGAKTDVPAVSPYLLAVNDINGDGKPDVVIAGYNLQILQNTSTATTISYGGTITSALSPNAFAMGICDFDGDGKADLAGAIFTSNIVSFLKNRSNEPYISYFSPTTAAAGTTVVIIGERFTGITSVTFGGVPASSFTVVNSTTINAVTGTGVSGKVEVTNAYGTAMLDGFIFAGPPVISSFSPTASGQGQTVTISGANFNNTTAVSFGGVPAASFTVVSGNTIEAVVGSGASGSLIVTTNYGADTLSGFTFLPFPFVTSFNPATAAAGDTVTITGINFSGASAVKFGGVPAASYTVNSPTSITAVVGNGASGAVSVTTGIGTGAKPGFIFIPAPVITSASPLSGRSGTAVTITGTDFTGATNVFFGGIPAEYFTVVSPAVINAVVGVGASGNISVKGPGGTATLTGFNFIPRPVITSISPVSASAGSSIVISGSGFSPLVTGNTVTIGSVTAVVTAASTTSLTVTVPQVTTNQPVELLVGGLIATSPQIFSTTYTVSDTAFNASSFSPPVKIASKLYPSGFSSDGSITVDIDGDNKQEIISGNLITKMISILRNTGNGTTVSFAQPLDVASLWIPGGIVAGDLDGDGKPEIVCGNESFSNAISIFRNTSTPGNISFATRIDYGTIVASVMNVSLGDLDNDGRKDIIMRTTGSNTTYLCVYRNKSTPGNIAFDTQLTFEIGSGGSSYFDIITEDLDGDGKMDILSSKPNITCLVNQSMPGAIAFSAPVTISPTGANFLFNITVADINTDGKKDIVTLSANTLKVFKNQSNPGNVNFAETTVYVFPGSNARGLAAGDLNGDAKPEIVTLQGGSPVLYEYSVFNNMCSGNSIAFGNKVSTVYSPLRAFGYADITDVDGDNKMDIILTFTSTDSAYILRNQMSVSSVQMCSNSNITLNSSINGSSYQWQQNSGSGFSDISDNVTFSGTSTANLQINNPPVGWSGNKYRCRVNNTITGNEITVTVTLAPVANAGADVTICAGAATQLNGSGGATFLWSPPLGLSDINIANPVATPGVTTAYILTVSNGSSCLAKDTVLVTVNQLLPAAVTISTPGNSVCAGTNVVFTATPVNGGTNPAYQWKINGSNAGINSNQYVTSLINNKDTVSVILTSNSGCSSNPVAVSNSIIMSVTPLATPAVTLSNRAYTVINPDAAAVYTWQILTNGIWNNVTPSATGITFTAPAAGEYRVMATKGPCTVYSASLVTNKATTPNNPFGIFVYPNPARETITVDSIKLQQNWETLETMNAEGKIVLPAKNIQNQTKVSIDISKLGKGTYFIRFRRKDGETTTIKFVKN